MRIKLKGTRMASPPALLLALTFAGHGVAGRVCGGGNWFFVDIRVGDEGLVGAMLWNYGDVDGMVIMSHAHLKR